VPALVRAALAFLAGVAILFPGTGSAAAAGTGLQVHHLLPEDGAVGIAPDDTGRLVDLPHGPLVDGPVVVQPLPPLAPGHYTVGVQVLDRTGHLARGTFGFTVDPAVVRAAGPGGSGTDGSGSSDDAAWIAPAAATALLLPAALLALRRRRR